MKQFFKIKLSHLLVLAVILAVAILLPLLLVSSKDDVRFLSSTDIGIELQQALDDNTHLQSILKRRNFNNVSFNKIDLTAGGGTGYFNIVGQRDKELLVYWNNVHQGGYDLYQLATYEKGNYDLIWRK